MELLFLAANTGNFCNQVLQLKDIYNYYYKVLPKIGFIYNMINKKPSLDEEGSQSELEKIEFFAPEKNIVFKNITFSYDGITNVINDLSFEFLTNKINLLLGPNGSGKTTLIKLLLRLYKLPTNTKNKILLHGVDINQIDLATLRNKITFVSQDSNIFNNTILYNIKYGNEEVSDNKIITLSDFFCSRDWLIQNKNKLTGFRGKNISGGEKKKIQLINALCKNSEIIIFDEPTNTLDSKAIEWFKEFITKLKNEYLKTIIIITHDMRLVKISDCVVSIGDVPSPPQHQ